MKARFLVSAVLPLFLLLIAVAGRTSGATFRWLGSENDDWHDAANWENGLVPALDADNGRTNTITIANGENHPLRFNRADEVLWLDTFQVQNGHLIMDAGTVIVTNSAQTVSRIGGFNHGGTMTVNGGRLVFAQWDSLYVSENGPSSAKLILNDGTIEFFRYSLRGGTRGAVAEMHLNGGVMNVLQPTETGVGTNLVCFNGGTLRAGGNWPYSQQSMANYAFNAQPALIRAGGAVIDVPAANRTAVIQCGLEHSTLEGDPAIDGGLRKTGAGTLTLMGTNTWTGATILEGGTLRLPAGSEMRFAPQEGLPLPNRISGSGTVRFEGCLRIDPAAAGHAGEWQLFDPETLQVVYESTTFSVALTDGTRLESLEDGTCATPQWRFTPETGMLRKIPLASLFILH